MVNETDNSFIIVAGVSKNGVIGHQGGIPWSGYEEDREFMHELTESKVTIVGENTYNPNSNNIDPYRIVLTEDEYIGNSNPNVLVANSLEDCIKIADRLYTEENLSEFYVCGGAEVYSQFYDIVDRMYITRIPEICDGDTYFPFFDMHNFERTNIVDLDSCHVHIYDRD